MRQLVVGTLIVAVAALVGPARADDKANATGTWKWSVEFNGQKREMTLKLKQEGDKLTGAMIGRNNNETAIDDGTIKNGEVSFTVTRERNGQKFTQKYSGKVVGDTIKGKVEFEREGQAQTRDWEATRAKD
jgi:hypothetical protein